MFKAFSESLLLELRGRQAELDVTVRPGALLRERTRLILDAMYFLAGYVEEHPFVDSDEELYCNKFVLPEFYALLYAAQERYDMARHLPASGAKAKRKYYLALLKRVAAILGQYTFYHEYWSGDGLLLDELLYGTADTANVLQPVFAGFEGLPGTVMSRLAGMFMALEELRAELLTTMYGLEPKPSLSCTSVSEDGGLVSRFQWKGEVVNLIELGHGIYLSGQLEPSIGIVEFFKALGDFFGVNLRVPRRGFDDLKKRKTMSQTHFCELMASVLRQKMEDEDAYDPGRKLRKNGFYK